MLVSLPAGMCSPIGVPFAVAAVHRAASVAGEKLTGASEDVRAAAFAGEAPAADSQHGRNRLARHLGNVAGIRLPADLVRMVVMGALVTLPVGVVAGERH